MICLGMFRRGRNYEIQDSQRHGYDNIGLIKLLRVAHEVPKVIDKTI
jgi:hypothetical protein